MKLHRWMDLVAVLLARHYGATFEELREEVPGYAAGSLESVRRAFERDKDQLRALGVPIETLGDHGDAEMRYRLRPGGFYLPYLVLVEERGLAAPRRVDADGYRALAACEFGTDELALLADAARRVMLCGDPILADDARHALGKLFVDVPAEVLQPTPGVGVAAPRAAAAPAHLQQLGDALARRKQVTFTYHGIERDEAERRTVLPYGLAYTSGHWYLHAHDPARGAIRRFRLSRMKEVEVNAQSPRAQDYEIPADFSLAAVAEPVASWALGDDAEEMVTVRFVGDGVAVRAARAEGAAVAEDDALVRFRVRRREAFLRWLLPLVGEAMPEAPPDLARAWDALVQRTLAAHLGEAA